MQDSLSDSVAFDLRRHTIKDKNWENIVLKEVDDSFYEHFDVNILELATFQAWLSIKYFKHPYWGVYRNFQATEFWNVDGMSWCGQEFPKVMHSHYVI